MMSESDRLAWLAQFAKAADGFASTRISGRAASVQAWQDAFREALTEPGHNIDLVHVPLPPPRATHTRDVVDQ